MALTGVAGISCLFCFLLALPILDLAGAETPADPVEAERQALTLKESKLLKEGHVFTADAYAGRTEADIEDILGASLYIELVNKAYALKPPLALPEPMAATDHSALRIVQYVEAEMSRRQPAVYFDHYRPAEHLVRLGDPETLPGFKDALGRFERLFSELNRLLPV